MRAIILQGVRNVRDLGGIPVGAGLQVRSGLLYRGSSLHGATPADEHVLFTELGITCTIDLRCGWECQAHPYSTPSGIEHLHIPFYDREKVGIEYVEPAIGTKVIGRDVACDPIRFYRSLPNPLTARQMRIALECVHDHVLNEQPVYFHCSGGKDRAGVLTALILQALGASPEAILDDYLLTNVDRDRDYAQLFRRFLRLADGDRVRAQELVVSHRALPQNLAAFYESVEERYGSMEAFFAGRLGMDGKRCESFRQACTCLACAQSA